MASNNLEAITKDCFEGGFNLVLLKLNHNFIKVFKKTTIHSLNNLTFLDLSFNYLHYLFTDGGKLPRSLKVVDVLNNSLGDTSGKMFSSTDLKLIFTHNYKMCCGFTSMCTAVMPWYRNCLSILNNAAYRWVCCCLFLAILITNLALIIKQNTKSVCSESGSFRIIFTFINLSNLSCALYLFIVWYSDLKFHDYAFREQEWRSSSICLFAFMVLFIFKITEALSSGLLSLSRCMVTIYPFHSKFKETEFAKRMTLIISLGSFVLTICVAIIIKTNYSELPFRLCSPLVDPTLSNTLVLIITWFLTALQNMIFISNIFLTL